MKSWNAVSQINEIMERCIFLISAILVLVFPFDADIIRRAQASKPFVKFIKLIKYKTIQLLENIANGKQKLT
jgi:hypothetical protein